MSFEIFIHSHVHSLIQCSSNYWVPSVPLDFLSKQRPLSSRRGREVAQSRATLWTISVGPHLGKHWLGPLDSLGIPCHVRSGIAHSSPDPLAKKQDSSYLLCVACSPLAGQLSGYKVKGNDHVFNIDSVQGPLRWSGWGGGVVVSNSWPGSRWEQPRPILILVVMLPLNTHNQN